MKNSSLLIGVDVGTTAVKLGVFDGHGELLFKHREEYPTHYLGNDGVEQDADDWISPVRRGLGRIAEQFNVNDIAALGVSSQVNSHVFVDRAGKPLMPAFVWKDGRAAQEAEFLDSRISSAQKELWWGTQMPIDASHALSRMLWVKRHHPETWENTHMVLSPKDYCLYCLTGEFSTDPITSFALVDMDGKYIPELFALVPGAREKSAEIHRFDQIIGHVRLSEKQGKAIPVTAGTMDAWANIFGSGAFEDGKGIYMSGTSEIVALVSGQRHSGEGIISFLPIDGLTVHAGPTQSGGDSMLWAAQLLNRPVEELLPEMEKRPRGPGEVLFLPHLQGERAPFWDTYSRGTFTGLSSSNSSIDMFQAVLEGVAFSVRALLEAAEAVAGREYPELLIGGGGSLSDLWCQIRADVLNRKLHKVACHETGVLGAAIIAAVGVGLFPNYRMASVEMVHVTKTFTPDQDIFQKYDIGYRRYLAIYQALKGIYHDQFNPT